MMLTNGKKIGLDIDLSKTKSNHKAQPLRHFQMEHPPKKADPDFAAWYLAKYLTTQPPA